MVPQPKWLDRKAYKREWKRIQHTLAEEKNEELLKRLEKNNRDFGDLLGHHRRMESLNVPKSAINAKRYDRVRKQASCLYYSLNWTFTQPCGCQLPHTANLQLEF
jgi:hypothetical protein